MSVIGNSMGGAIALSLAASRPELVERIVLMGTTGVAFDLSAGLDQVWGYTPGREERRALVELFAHDDSIATDDLVELRFRQSADAAARASYEASSPLRDSAGSTTSLSVTTGFVASPTGRCSCTAARTRSSPSRPR